MTKVPKPKYDKDGNIGNWPLHEMSLTPPWSSDTKMIVPAFETLLRLITPPKDQPDWDKETQDMVHETTRQVEAYFDKLKKEAKDGNE